jgi:hypothetical protein
MCRALVLRGPLVSVEEAMAEVAEAADPATLWARALADIDAELRALVLHARAVGLDGEEVEEAECAIRAPVGDSEIARLRALQFRQEAAAALATHLRAAGHASPEIAEWAEAGEDERRVRPRLA